MAQATRVEIDRFAHAVGIDVAGLGDDECFPHLFVTAAERYARNPTERGPFAVERSEHSAVLCDPRFVSGLKAALRERPEVFADFLKAKPERSR